MVRARLALSTRAHWWKWGSRAGFSIADQGLISGANFAVNILLARWLAPEGYGAFAVAFSIFIFVSGFHNAMVLEPMSVIGPSNYRDVVGRYLGATLWIQLGIGICLAGIIAIGIAVARPADRQMVLALLGLALASPFILLFWFFRRACYVGTRPDLALRGSLTYAIFIAVGLVLFRRQNWLSPAAGFLIMGLASFLGSLVFLYIHRAWIGGALRHGGALSTRPILHEHWNYGKWVVGSAFAHWVGGAAYLPLVAAVGGLAQAGALKAVQNLVLPFQHTITAVGLVLLPWLSRKRSVRGRSYVRDALPRMASANVLLAVLYVLVVLLFAEQLIDLLYPGDLYSDYLWLVPFIGVAVILGAANDSLRIGLRALKRPDSLFRAQVASATLTLTLGIYLVARLGLLGAVLGLISAALALTVLALFYIRMDLRRRN